MAQALAGDLSPAGRLASAERLRSLAGPEHGPLALEQALLKARARAKHPAGDRLWWTPEALEQASAHEVARHRAGRFAEAAAVLDVGCSVGADLLELAAVAPAYGVDIDPVRLRLARANAAELDRPVALALADAAALHPRGLVFADPARRSGGRRVFDPRAFRPPLDLLLGWLPRLAGLAVKVAPGIDYRLLPAGLEVEVVSLRGQVKEAVLWGGDLRRGAPRTATLLPEGVSLVRRGVPAPPVAPPGPFLLDPDGAVVRAHLVAELAADVQGWLLDPTIAYIGADRPVPTPFGRWYAVAESLPFGLKPLRQHLRARDAGPVVVKKRGTAVEPERLRRQLGLRGSQEVTVVLTRSAGRQVALVVEPVAAPARGSVAPGPVAQR